MRRFGLALSAAVLAVGASAHPVSAYPPADAAYLDYAEMVAAVQAIEAAHPAIVELFSIGRSHEGRELWAVKVSDNVATDEPEPEVVFDAGMHAREHLTTEMAVALLRSLVDGYGTTPRVKGLVDSNEIFILLNLNPDGSEFDHRSGVYQGWRKNMQPTPGTQFVGTDINRNFAYQWGTQAANASPWVETYHGPAAWSTPEATAFRRFVESRVIGGEQQIRVHVTLHQHGRVVLYPYGYTRTTVPADMTAADHDVLAAMAAEMGRRSGYAAAQSGVWAGVNVGNQMDWLYATYRVMTFTFEMGDAFYMPDEAIATETARNIDAAYYAIEQAGCPYGVTGRSEQHCPPSWVSRQAGSDRFETAAAVSSATFDPGAPVAYVSTGLDFPDALAGGVAAAREGGPVLLVRPTSIPAATGRELDRLNPGRIVVLGGESAVSRAVLDALRGYTTGTVTRVFGADRFATAAAVSRATFPAARPSVAFVATGLDFPDALAGVPAAVAAGGPLLLVRPTSIPAATATELRRLSPGRIVVLGGESAVSRPVLDALRGYTSGTVTRVFGSDRYATAAEIARTFSTRTGGVAYLATGLTFADALSGGPAAASAGAPVLLVRPTVLPAPTATRLDAMAPTRIVVLGGTAAVSREVAATAALAAR